MWRRAAHTARAAPIPSSQIRVVVAKFGVRGDGDGVPHGVDEGRDRQGGEDGPDRPEAGPPTVAVGRPAPTAAQEQDEQDEAQRPDDVELLLDRQRPVVLHRGGLGALGEVVDRAPRQDPVDDVDRRPDDVAAYLAPPPPRHQEPRGDRDRDEDEDGRRQQPAGPPRHEPWPRDRARGGQLAQQQPGDEVAGDDEEDVDAEEAVRQERQARVVDQHEQDGDRPQALDVGPEALRPGRPGQVRTPRAGGPQGPRGPGR